MNHLSYRYGAILTILIGGFANFIACGSMMYQASVEDDYDHERVVKANPEVKDPESTLYGIHATSGWVELPVVYRFGEKMDSEQRQHLQAAMRLWETAVGKKLFSVEGIHQKTTGDSFKDLYSSLDDDINGHYLDDNWGKTKKSESVLATTIWSNADQTSIKTADIRFNHEKYVIGDSLLREAKDGKEVVDMQSLALHELGHLLGLAHVDAEVDEYSIMNPTLFIGEGLTSRSLSPGDIERIQTIYGCEGDACDMEKLQKQLAELPNLELTDPLHVKAH